MRRYPDQPWSAGKLMTFQALFSRPAEFGPYGQKAKGREKVLCVSINSPHSEKSPGQMAGPSNSPFWILGNTMVPARTRIFTFLGPFLGA